MPDGAFARRLPVRDVGVLVAEGHKLADQVRRIGLADRLHPIYVSSDPQGGGDGTSALTLAKTPHKVDAELFDLPDHVRVPIRIQRESQVPQRARHLDVHSVVE